MKKIAITLFIIFMLGISSNLVYGQNSLSNKEERKTLKFDSINLEMVECPAGSFKMGSPNKELGKNSFESLHNVTISKPF